MDLGGRAAALGRALLTAATNRAATGGLVWIAFALLLCSAAAPVFSTVLPPLFDYPNHLARMSLLAAGGNRFYSVRWAVLPNLAEDLVVPPLARLVPLETAGKLFLVAIFGLIAAGVVFLNRVATGGWRFWPLAVFLLLYNRILLWGFLNYLFGLGAWLFGLGLWLALEERRPWLRLVVSSAAALVCFFSHLAAFAIYALTVCGVELPDAVVAIRARCWSALERRATIVGGQFVLPSILFFRWLWRWNQPGSGGISFAAFPRKLDLLFSVFDNYDRVFDIFGFVLFIGLLFWLGLTGRLGLAPRIGSALGLLFVTYLLSPSQIYGGSGLDHRLPLALFLLLVAGSAPSFPSRRAAIAVSSAVGLLLALRLAVVELIWLRADRIYSADLAGIDKLPRGVRLAVAYPANMIHVASVPEVHLAAMAVVRRDAFVPTLFAIPGQQPLALRAPWTAIAGAAQPPALWAVLTGGTLRPPLPSQLASFDAVALVGSGPVTALPNSCIEPVFSGPNLRIFAIGCRVGRG